MFQKLSFLAIFVLSLHAGAYGMPDAARAACAEELAQFCTEYNGDMLARCLASQPRISSGCRNAVDGKAAPVGQALKEQAETSNSLDKLKEAMEQAAKEQEGR